jgi:hypothetical protein
MIRPFAILVAICVSAYAVDIPSTLDANSQTYQGVTYMSHDASSLTIMHESGVTSVPLSSLPDDLRNQLGYKPGASATSPVTTPDGAVGRSLDECRSKYGELSQDEKDADVFHAHKTISGGTRVKISLTFKHAHCVKIEYRKIFVPGAAEADKYGRVAPGKYVELNYMQFLGDEAAELRAINFGSQKEDVGRVGSSPQPFRISENKKFVSPFSLDPVTILAIDYVDEDAAKATQNENTAREKGRRAVSERMGGL